VLAAGSTVSSSLPGFLDPSRLDRLQDLLAAALRVVVEIVQLPHPLEEVGEADGLWVDIGMLVRKGDGGDAAEESADIKGGIRATGPAELAPSSKF